MGFTVGIEILSFYARIACFVLSHALGGFLSLARTFIDVFVEESLSGPFVLPPIFLSLIKCTVFQQMQCSLLFVSHDS